MVDVSSHSGYNQLSKLENMKRTIFLSVLSCLLFGIVEAQPSKLKRHAHEHQKKDAVVFYATHIKVPIPQATGSSHFNSYHSDATQSSQNGEQVEGADTREADPDLALRQATAAGGWGFTYSPFKSDGSCKIADDVKKDFEKLVKEYALVRIYGTSCNQVANVLAAAQKYNFKIFAGIFDINQVEQEARILIDAAKSDWSRFQTISIGNEVVNATPDNQKAAMVNKVVNAIGRARSILDGTGYRGNIVTVDTWIAARAYPALCKASDYCAVNIHPFFDGGVAADGAGKFVSEQLQTLVNVIPRGQKIVVTETGWPWKGNANRAAVPSLPNQTKALESIKKVFQSNKSGVILFTIYNDRWKKNNADQFGAEQWWGKLKRKRIERKTDNGLITGIKGLDAPSG